jgi:hypothetical protein
MADLSAVHKNANNLLAHCASHFEQQEGYPPPLFRIGQIAAVVVDFPNVHKAMCRAGRLNYPSICWHACHFHAMDGLINKLCKTSGLIAGAKANAKCVARFCMNHSRVRSGIVAVRDRALEQMRLQNGRAPRPMFFTRGRGSRAYPAYFTIRRVWQLLNISRLFFSSPEAQQHGGHEENFAQVKQLTVHRHDAFKRQLAIAGAVLRPAIKALKLMDGTDNVLTCSLNFSL